MKRFAYVFAIGNKVVWSGETEETLRNRMAGTIHAADDDGLIEDFIEANKVGSFICLKGGEMVFQIA